MSHDLKTKIDGGMIEITNDVHVDEARNAQFSAAEYLAEQGAPVEFGNDGIKKLSTTTSSSGERRTDSILGSARGMALQSIDINNARPDEVRVLVDGCECTLLTAMKLGRVVRDGSGYREIPKQAAQAPQAKAPVQAPGSDLGEEWANCRRACPSADNAFVSLISAAASQNTDRINHSLVTFKNNIGAERESMDQTKKIANYLLGRLSNQISSHIEAQFPDLAGVGDKALDKLMGSMSPSEREAIYTRTYFGDSSWKAEVTTRLSRMARTSDKK